MVLASGLVDRVRPTVRGLAAGLVALVYTGCSLLVGADGISEGGPDASTAPDATTHAEGSSNTSATSDAGADSHAGDSAEPGDAGCPILVDAGGNVCTAIPAFLGAQVVDGIGDEFCAIPATTFVVSKGIATVNPGAASQIQTVVYLRMAWSPDAIHLFMNVVEPMVHSPPPGAPFQGDAIEVYISPSSLLHGTFGADASDVGVHLTCAAPAAAQPPFAESFGFPALTPITVLDGGQFAARLVDGGYNLEVELSWATLATLSAGPELSPGALSTIGIDFQCDIGDGDGGRTFQSSLALQSFAGSTTCPQYVHGILPYCDDRTWCTPTLTP